VGHRPEAGEAVSVIAGLGNPGPRYEGTRHNAGFMVVDELARRAGAVLQERKFRAAWARGAVAGHPVLFVKPLTFMNLSGEAVGAVLRYFGVPPGALLVVHDDLDLPVGRLRLGRGGGAGGHRGVLSIVDHAGTLDFLRLRVGIGRPRFGEPVEAYVLEPPYPDERAVFEEAVSRAVEAAEEVLRSGLAAAMNRYNRKEA